MDTEPHDRDELARRAKDLYERRIRERVEADGANEGRFVAIDVESGDFEVADDVLGAGTGLRLRRPGASVYLLRVGRPADFRALLGRSRVRLLPMMRGSVAEDGSEPLLPVGLLAGAVNGGREEMSLEVEAVIDTGFDGELTLPLETIRRLGYPYTGSAGGTLADGSEVQFDYHEGRVLRHGVVRPVAVIVAVTEL